MRGRPVSAAIGGLPHLNPLRAGIVKDVAALTDYPFTGHSALKGAGETYDRRMQLQSAGLGLSEVIDAVCQNFGIDEMELTCLTKRSAVAQARGLIGYIATRELSIPGSMVARRFNQDRSAVSRAAQQVSQNAALLGIARRILQRFDSK